MEKAEQLKKENTAEENVSVILVDENDKETGTSEKMAAHIKGELHRAFSVFLIDDEGRILLQRRNKQKYHCGGLWTNSCCSHPSPGETVETAASRRMQEELGIEASAHEVGSFVYRSVFENGLTEYEFDHVLVSYYSGSFDFNVDEIEAFRYISFDNLERELCEQPDKFTPWIGPAFEIVKKNINN